MKKYRENNYIISLSDSSHDSGAVLYKQSEDIFFDLDNLFCTNEERYNREKNSRKFPIKSITEGINFLKLDNLKLGNFLVGSKFTPIFIYKFFRNYINKNQFNLFFNLYITYQVLARSFKLIGFFEIIFGKIYYKLKFKNIFGNIKVIDHHLSHACAAYYSSGYSESLVVTIDLIGDGETVSVSEGRGNEVKKIFSQNGFSAIGTFYAKITQILGFIPARHEGKIMGLAAYGKKILKFIIFLRKFLDIKMDVLIM